MSDRELLELAAKAGGAIRFEWAEAFDDYYNDMAGHPTQGLWIHEAVDGLGSFPFDRIWNPLTDDGDALRLAVKLNMCVTSFADEIMVGCIIAGDGRNFHEAIDTDPYAATRSAIVRAAAEIGRAMK
jgi:hypothetical protein